MLIIMRYLAIMLLLLSACAEDLSQVRAVPRDPMYDLCMVSDYSYHTNKEVRACGDWLRARVAPWRTGIGLAPAPAPAPAPSSGPLVIMHPNGTASMYSCDSGACLQIK